MKVMSKHEHMKAIRDEVIALTSSPLYEYRTKNNYMPVIGQGSHDADIVFIGEAPGRNEAKTGVPFCGAAGKILDDLLDSVDISRDDIYITNIVKDRPQENRDPTPEEIAIYGPFLDRQLQIIKPKVIATLGRYSMEFIFKKYGLDRELEPISKAHGKQYTADDGTIIIPLYHPAAAIYNRSLIDTLKDDFKQLAIFT